MALGKEVGFGKDNFSKPRMLSNKDTICNLILNLLLMKPGNLPTQPELGIDIKSYLYKDEDQIDVNELRNKIYNQCQEFLPYIISNDIKFYINTVGGKNVLMLYLPIVLEGINDGILYAFQDDNAGGVNSGFKFTDLKI